MFLPVLSTVALAQNFQAPNSTLGVSGGSPVLMSVRGEAWITRQVSTELGVGLSVPGAERLFGVQGAEPAAPVFDAALRWRPPVLCLGCGERVLGTVGIGVGSVVAPAVDLADPWTWALGADLCATAVYWFTPTSGIHATLRGGAGPEWVGSNLGDPGFGWWAFGTLGFAF